MTALAWLIGIYAGGYVIAPLWMGWEHPEGAVSQLTPLEVAKQNLLIYLIWPVALLLAVAEWATRPKRDDEHDAY